MFTLLSKTSPAWLDMVLPHLDQLLIEQAHLERKAAASAVQFTFMYPQYPELHAPLLELAEEELQHFQMSLAQLAQRRVAYGPLEPSPYAERLLQAVRRKEPQKMLDRMMCNAVIEARSCERMQILGRALRDEDLTLSRFYLELVETEARHHGLYLDLARQVFTRQQVEERLQQICEHEAAVLERAPRVPRLHN